MAKRKQRTAKDYTRIEKDSVRLEKIVLEQQRLLSNVWDFLHNLKKDVRRLSPTHLPGLIERKIDHFVSQSKEEFKDE